MDASPQAGDNTVSWDDLATIALPLPAFLSTNSHRALINPQPIFYLHDPHPRRGEVRLCYPIDPRFFHSETSLDEPLVALLRANRWSRSSCRWPLRVTVELIFNSERSLSPVWSVLVISSPSEVEREDCVNHVNRLLRTIVRPGFVRPLSAEEQAMFGKAPKRKRR